MRQRQLGSDGLVTSALGMGCMGLSQGYGPADDDESVRAIRRAAELGVTMFDTAMSYGQGHNERLIGQALAGLPWPHHGSDSSDPPDTRLWRDVLRPLASSPSDW